MGMVDYEFYQDVYYGEKLNNDNEFKKLARDAELTVNRFTFGRINGDLNYKMTPDVEKLVKLTICSIMDSQYDYNNRDRTQSISSGPYSKTFEKNKSESDLSVYHESIINRNLFSTGLTIKYIGVW